MIDLSNNYLNDLESGASAVVKTLVGALDTDNRGATTYLEEGDFLFLGRTTEDALLGTPIILLKEDFPVGANLDFGYVTYDDSGPTGITITHAAVPICSADIANAAKMIRLPWSSKQANSDGTEYTGEDGLVWGGTALGCIYHGASATTGELSIVIPSTSFDSKTPGAYLTRGL